MAFGPNYFNAINFYLFPLSMADRPHKAHRPPTSGGKIGKKEKGKKGGFNEKVHLVALR